MLDYPVQPSCKQTENIMALVNMYGNGTSYDIAVIRGRKTQAGWAIWEFLQNDGRDFDVVVLQPGETFGQIAGRAVSVPVIRYTKANMPPWLVLYHELGHVKQYYQPAASVQNADVVGLWNIRLTDAAAIEAENLALHENPICRQIHIAERRHYKHMANGMGNVASAYVMKKAPALRVADDAAVRILQDAALLALVTHGAVPPATGFFTK
jgi:hypothetical protein